MAKMLNMSGVSGERSTAHSVTKIGDWYTQAEVCERHGISPATCRRWVSAGRLERRRGEGRNLYRATAHLPLTAHDERPTAHLPLTAHRSSTAHQAVEGWRELLARTEEQAVLIAGLLRDLAQERMAHRQVLELNQQLAEEVDDLSEDNVRLEGELEDMSATMMRSDRLVDLATETIRALRK